MSRNALTPCTWCDTPTVPGNSACYGCSQALIRGPMPPRTGWLAWSLTGMVLR